MSITVVHVESEKNAPLYHKYERQSSAQPAFISLDLEDQELRADWNSEIGNGIPMDVYLGHTRRFRIPSDLSKTAINNLLDEIKPLAEKVLSGYESYWDGNNHQARLNDVAEEALEAIERVCEDMEYSHDDRVQTYDVEEWFEHENGHISNMIEDGMSVDDIAETLWKESQDEAGSNISLDFDKDDIVDYLKEEFADEFEARDEIEEIEDDE